MSLCCYAGKRQAVPAKPMEPLSTVIAQAIEIMKLDTDAGSCKLMHNGKQLDPSTPVRFANLPRDAKLELITGRSSYMVPDINNYAIQEPAGSACTEARNRPAASRCCRLHVVFPAIVLPCWEGTLKGSPILQARLNSSWASETSSIPAHSLLGSPLPPLRAWRQQPRPTSLSRQALPRSPSQPRGSAPCSAEAQTPPAAPAVGGPSCLRCRQSSVPWVWAGQSTSSHGKQHSLQKAKGDCTWPTASSQLSVVAAVFFES